MTEEPSVDGIDHLSAVILTKGVCQRESQIPSIIPVSRTNALESSAYAVVLTPELLRISFNIMIDGSGICEDY